jgi:basic membrane protein A and related proteins
MRSRLFAALFALAAGAAAGPARAAALKPAIIYDTGGKFDRSFNQSASVGVARFTAATHIPVRELEITNDAQRAEYMQLLARRGYNLIVAVGFNQAAAVQDVAPEHPAVKFVLIDSVVDLPNVESVTFREEESSYLCGMAAALATKTGKIGFVGGMDIPLIRKFEAGYEAGARHVDPHIIIYANMTGTTPDAWTNPTRGVELATSQIERGADVIFHAAGATGIGVLQAAKDHGVLGIGCDSDQDYLHPGSVLTSAVKHVDVAVFKALEEAQAGTWKPGHRVLGLADDGVGYSYDQDNAKILTPAIRRQLDRARAEIIAGKIEVPTVPTQ